MTYTGVRVHLSSECNCACLSVPDGQLLALGSRDNMVYIYEVSEDGLKYSKRGRCSVSPGFLFLCHLYLGLLLQCHLFMYITDLHVDMVVLKFGLKPFFFQEISL